MKECRLILGDSLAVLPTLADGSVDAVVTDPPYGQTNESYDSPIAFRPDVWRECYRIAGRNAALLAFAGSPTYHRIASAIEAGGWKVRQMWAWVYRDGLITSAWPKEGFDRLAPAMDPIVFATKGKVILNLQREGEPWAVVKRSQRSPLSGRSSPIMLQEATGHWPRNILSDGCDGFAWFGHARTKSRADGPTRHPNQKPLALMRWLVSKLPPGGTILDPFAGSGSTGKAAIAEGFRFIGVEQSPEYFAIAKQRLRTARRQETVSA